MTEHTPHYIGRYEVLGKLGEGGMAAVYRAMDSRLKREVALKLIRSDMFGPAMLEQLLARFEREATSLARMAHPNIVTVYDFGEHENAPYIVMEYLPGGTLRKEMDHPVHYGKAAALLRPVAEALTYAHAKGIIHRDIKPANILFGETGAPKLSDFGIARLLGMEGNTQLTGTGMGVGTPAYMAPEQWRGEVSPAVDIYALGVVLYELITGRQPYQATTPADLFLKMATTPPENPRQFIPDLPEHVLEVLNLALAPDPAARYADMAAFVTALATLSETGTRPTTVMQNPQGDKTAINPVVSSGSEKTMPPLAHQTASSEKSPMMDSGATINASPSILRESMRSADTGATINAPPPPPSPSTTGSRLTTGREPTAGVASNSQPNQAKTGPVYPQGSTDVRKMGSQVGQPSPIGPAADAETADKPPQTIARWLPFAVGAGIIIVVLAVILWPGGPLAAAFTPVPTPTLTSTLTSTPAPTTAPTATVTLTSQPTITSTPTLGPGDMLVSSMDGMKLAFIPAGSFIMGSANGDDDEKVLPGVTLDAFWLDTTEVTNAMFAKCVTAGICQPPTDVTSFSRSLYYGDPQYDSFPVVYVNWEQAQTYCAWAGRRLPTEAEWEYAARGGLDGQTFAWGNDQPNCTEGASNGAQFKTCVIDDTIAVGLFAPNGFGIYDVVGNVWEWVADWYGPYQSGELQNPVGPASGDQRVMRGGSWYHPEEIIRVANRALNDPAASLFDIGFRCAATP